MDTNCLPLCPSHVGKHGVRKQCARGLHHERQLRRQWLRRNRATTLAADELQAFALASGIVVPDLALSGRLRVKNSLCAHFVRNCHSMLNIACVSPTLSRPPERKPVEVLAQFQIAADIVTATHSFGWIAKQRPKQPLDTTATI